MQITQLIWKFYPLCPNNKQIILINLINLIASINILINFAQTAWHLLKLV